MLSILWARQNASHRRLGKCRQRSVSSCFFGWFKVVCVISCVHRSRLRSAYGRMSMVCGCFSLIGISGTCAEYANVAGHDIPKWVRRSGPCTLGLATGRVSLDTSASAKLIPLHHFTHSSDTRKLFSEGPHAVMVCQSERARS